MDDIGKLVPSKNTKIDEIVVVPEFIKDFIDTVIDELGYSYKLERDYRSCGRQESFKGGSGHTWKCIIIINKKTGAQAVYPYYMLSYLYTLVYRLEDQSLPNIKDTVIKYFNNNLVWFTYENYSIGKEINRVLLDLGIYYSYVEDSNKQKVVFHVFERNEKDIIANVLIMNKLLSREALALLETMGFMNIYTSFEQPKLNNLNSSQILQIVINFVNKLFKEEK